jgi:hypothetical protein
VNSQQLFYFNLIVGVLFIAYFFFGRAKQKPPTKLNLRANGSEESSHREKEVVSEKNQTKNLVVESKQSILEPEVLKSKPSTQTNQNTKQLSIFFMYNGHDWEAHEILGIPQGASVDVATKAYQEQLKTSDPSSYEFLESAYNAIFKKRRNERL